MGKQTDRYLNKSLNLEKLIILTTGFIAFFQNNHTYGSGPHFDSLMSNVFNYRLFDVHKFANFNPNLKIQIVKLHPCHRQIVTNIFTL